MPVGSLSFSLHDGGSPDVLLRAADYAPDRHQARHAHDCTTVTLHLAGGIREWVRGEDIVSRGLRVSIKPAGIPHADLYGAAGARTFQVVLARSFRADWKPWAAALAEWRWVAGPAVRAALALLYAARTQPGNHDDLREGLIRLLDTLAETPSGSAPAAPPSWLSRALEFLHDRPGESVRVREVAGAAGVHPVHLARVFRRHLGCTVTAYARRIRLERAATLLSLGRSPIPAVAQTCGFADQSHLTRALRRDIGLTPASFRRLARWADVASVQDRPRLRR